ncbi:exported hypothetical protein [uncultured Gammaproteobacteria bacterium]
MRQFPLILAALLALGAHAAAPQPQAEHEISMVLTCWQAGRVIVEEQEIIAISPVGRGMAFYRRDGSHLQLLSNDHRLAFCVLDLPKGLPDQPLATEASR